MSYTDFDFPHTHYYETDLRELICKVTKILKTVEELDDWKTEHEEEYEQLKMLVDKLYSGDWTPEFVETLVSWYKDNIIDIMGEMAKTVHFGLTNDGYFCAWIPDSWSFLTFDTINDFDDPLYGHLVLMYD